MTAVRPSLRNCIYFPRTKSKLARQAFAVSEIANDQGNRMTTVCLFRVPTRGKILIGPSAFMGTSFRLAWDKLSPTFYVFYPGFFPNVDVVPIWHKRTRLRRVRILQRYRRVFPSTKFVPGHPGLGTFDSCIAKRWYQLYLDCVEKCERS
jgi:hypothetical protein